MPKIIHQVETPFVETFRTAKVVGMFDVSSEKKLIKRWELDFPIETIKENWNIGLIVGGSGTGKTILSQKIFGEENYHRGFVWDNEKSFLDSFPEGVEIRDIVDVLSHVGLSSPPSWLLPFDKLSNGQKFRAEIARCLFEYNGLFIFDEFTSVVDRTVAKIGCAAIQKHIKKQNKKMVALSCHYDIIEWLQPDWYFDLSSNAFHVGSLRRPPIQLEIYKCHKSNWKLFKDYHYLSSNIALGAQCFVGLVWDTPCVFSSCINFQHPSIKKVKREHRTVVLPDYQGIGFGNIMSDFVAEQCVLDGFKYYSTTSHPAMIFARLKNSKWTMIRKPGIIMTPNKTYKSSAGSCSRITASFKFVGKLNNPSLP